MTRKTIWKLLVTALNGGAVIWMYVLTQHPWAWTIGVGLIILGYIDSKVSANLDNGIEKAVEKDNHTDQ